MSERDATKDGYAQYGKFTLMLGRARDRRGAYKMPVMDQEPNTATEQPLPLCFVLMYCELWDPGTVLTAGPTVEPNVRQIRDF